VAFGAFAPMPLRLGGSSTEGWSPEQHARVSADLIAAKLSVPFAVWTFTKSGATITIHDYHGQNGAGSAFAPVGVSGGTGIAGFGWASNAFDDAYGVSYPFKPRHARITPHGTSEIFATYQLNYLSLSIVILMFDSADAATDCKATVRIW